MAKRKSKKQGIEKVVRKFRDEMQKMVDEPGSGITGISISHAGRTVEVAKRKQQEPPVS